MRLLTLVISLLAAQAIAQPSSPVPHRRDKVPELVSFFAPIIFPKVIQDGYQLKEYVRSAEFAELRVKYGDSLAVDAIFAEAMDLCWNNVYEALFISLIATMDHSKFGVKVPLLGPLIWVPLTSEFEDEFSERVDALPRQIYADSPRNGTGDRDKLQHFFGSAFLAYTFESRESAGRVGEFIEWGEDKVIVDGALDERDFRANRHGQEFGLALLANDKIMPSKFLKVPVLQNESSNSRAPILSPPATDSEKK